MAILRVRPHHPYPYVAGQYATLESAAAAAGLAPVLDGHPAAPGPALEFHVRAAGRGGLSDALVGVRTR